MDFLKNLTIKQWLIILFVVIVFIITTLYFFRTPSRSQSDIDLESLMRQGTAPVSVDEALSNSEIEFLKKQGEVTPSTSTLPKNELTKEEKDALFKLMSAPRR